MPWYAIRTVYHFGTKSDGTNVFEERVVVFEAQSWSEAHSRAGVESEQYAKRNNVIAHPEQSGYEQDGAPLIDEYEVWSELFEARTSLEEFYAKRYGQFEYTPEDPAA
jgi:hypothetical protein